METALTYQPRVIDRVFDHAIERFSAVALEGAKAVGKTATARQRAATIFKLDEQEPLAVVQADLARTLEADPPVLFDEWQKHPPVWDAVRNADDEGAPPGSYILTGSADPKGVTSHSGAGRIVVFRMRPMSLYERLGQPQAVSLSELLDGGRPQIEGETDVDLEDYTAEILTGGFPGIRRYDGSDLRTQLNSYLNLIVDKDFEELGRRVQRPETLRRWMAAYGAASSTTASFETIRRAATSNENEKPAKTTIAPYRDALKRLFILDPVPAWRPANPLGELGDAEKHQLVDPALAARLVRATASRLLSGGATGPPIPRQGTQLGAFFESLVTQSVRVYTAAAEHAEPEVRHFRTHRGDHEVDLIVEREDGAVLAIEVKLAEVPSDDDAKHLHWLSDQIGDELIDQVIITTGKAAYRRQDGVAVIPAALLGP